MLRSRRARRCRHSLHRSCTDCSTTLRSRPAVTTPWTVRIAGREIWVGTDSARWLPKVDPANREVMLSLGAFLENLITAAPAHGFVADCKVVGAGPTTDVARVALESMAARDAPLERLRARRTVRSGQLDRDISTADVQALRAAGSDDDVLFFAARSQHGRRLAVGFQKEGTPAFQNLSPLTCPLA
jgi:hypothetical protein